MSQKNKPYFIGFLGTIDDPNLVISARATKKLDGEFYLDSSGLIVDRIGLDGSAACCDCHGRFSNPNWYSETQTTFEYELDVKDLSVDKINYLAQMLNANPKEFAAEVEGVLKTCREHGLKHKFLAAARKYVNLDEQELNTFFVETKNIFSK